MGVQSISKGYRDQEQRSGRGLIKLVGQIHKFLWGTMDSNDEDIIVKNIATLTNATNTLNEVATRSIRLFQTQIDVMNGNQHILKDQLEKAYQKLETMKVEFHHTQVYNVFIQVCTLALFELNDLEILSQEVLLAVQLGKQGIVDPSIFTPTHLVDSLKVFESELKKGHFLINIARNYQRFLDISEITIVGHNQNLIYILKYRILNLSHGH